MLSLIDTDNPNYSLEILFYEVFDHHKLYSLESDDVIGLDSFINAITTGIIAFAAKYHAYESAQKFLTGYVDPCIRFEFKNVNENEKSQIKKKLLNQTLEYINEEMKII
ncbi:hypothetical protein [Secundilactobacillus folii]|uniref:Uncharacterized protein n=1 Tax=Secundilactobacillus folii TaxID=2678357 RepID=A0A7X3C2B7_9LACO|nr:hypothetical protein [Secundilactobacillus folii]MTV82680.1 hypothetical protein [Secundilactobacillus folii]